MNFASQFRDDATLIVISALPPVHEKECEVLTGPSQIRI
jgi:hypothetical protein